MTAVSPGNSWGCGPAFAPAIFFSIENNQQRRRTTIDYQTLQAQWAERCERLRKANDSARTAIFEALAARGVTQVDVSFDGYADSGQIIDVSVTGACESLIGEVTLPVVPWDLAEAVEDLCYSLLEQEHAGWQDNDGAYGTLVFDVAAHTVTLECHVRYLPTRLLNMYSGRRTMAHPYHHALSSVRKWGGVVADSFPFLVLLGPKAIF